MAPMTAAERKRYLEEMKAKKAAEGTVTTDPAGLITRKPKRKADHPIEVPVESIPAAPRDRWSPGKDNKGKAVSEKKGKKTPSPSLIGAVKTSSSVPSFWDKGFDYGAYVKERLVFNPEDAESGSQGAVPFMMKDMGIHCLRTMLLIDSVDRKYEEVVQNEEALQATVRALEKELEEAGNAREKEVREAREAVTLEFEKRISDLKIGYAADLAGKDGVIAKLQNDVAAGAEREDQLMAEVSEAKGELALNFDAGFERAKAQFALLHPGADISALDPFKISVDGVLVDEP